MKIQRKIGTIILVIAIIGSLLFFALALYFWPIAYIIIFQGGSDHGGQLPLISISNEDLKSHEVTLEILESKYLFSWDKIPGDDNGRLIEFLTQEFGIDWVKTASIEKNASGSTINITNGTNFLLLRLEDERTKVPLTTNVHLEIDDGRTDEFIAETLDGKLNIYDSTNKSVFKETHKLSPKSEVSYPGDERIEAWEKGKTHEKIAHFIIIVDNKTTWTAYHGWMEPWKTTNIFIRSTENLEIRTIII